MIINRIILSFALLLFTFSSFAGFSSKEYASHTLKHEANGELEIKPDRAVFPVVFSVEEKTFTKALAMIRSMNDSLMQEAKNVDPDAVSVLPADFYKPGKGNKYSDISFFGGDKNDSNAKFTAYLNIHFKPQYDFWKRSALLAKALDFLKNFAKKYKTDEVSIRHDNAFYEVDNIEQYRKKLLELIYKKARTMAETIAKQEKAKLKIKYVSFDQYISKEIINFNRMVLSIPARIEYTFSY